MEDLDRHNEQVWNDLLRILKDGSAVLLVGAGCSKELGYPDWKELLQLMRGRLAPNLQLPPDNDYLSAFYQIKLESSKKNRYEDTEYHRFLRNTFAPKNSLCPTDLQCQLVYLPFAGIATTNYDVTLEAAVNQVYEYTDVGSHCQPINMCCDGVNRDKILDYLRNLADGYQPSEILHLHGVYNEPKKLILSTDEYESFYNGGVSQSEKPSSQRNKDTFHRRMIWALLATRPLVFVGFSLGDPFFNKVINVWHRDFQIGRKPPHIAFVGVSSNDERRQKYDHFTEKGVSPFFYEVPETDPTDHRNLRGCVSKLAKDTGRFYEQQSLAFVTKRTLGLE